MSILNGALGARFKAGLQSVMSGLGKTAPIKSPEKSCIDLDQSESGSLANGCNMESNCDLSKSITEPQTPESDESLLGNKEYDDEGLQMNDALLELEGRYFDL